jgi:hypothetical protein
MRARGTGRALASGIRLVRQGRIRTMGRKAAAAIVASAKATKQQEKDKTG